MATLRQIQANRRNAQKSTGPTTEEGKARSRKNALKHGLAGSGTVLPDLDADKLEARLESWRKLFVIRNADEEWLYEQLIISTIQVDAAQAEEFKIRANQAARAIGSWDTDRCDEIVKRAAGLSKKPELIYNELLCSRQGCAWLISQWQGLEASLAADGEWTPEQVQSAFDLQGVPLEFRHGRPWESDETPAAMVARQIGELQTMIDENLDILDNLRREMAAQGLDPEPNPRLDKIRRYEAACMRRYQWARRQLQSSGHVASPAPPIESARPEVVTPPQDARPRVEPPPTPPAAPQLPAANRPTPAPIPTVATPARKPVFGQPSSICLTDLIHGSTPATANRTARRATDSGKRRSR